MWVPIMLTRRDFLAGAAGLTAAASLVKSNRTVQDVIDMIIAEVPGAPWEPTVDTVKSGDPSQPVTGVITTFLATQAIVNLAAQHRINLVISHEPTYYNHLDETDWLADDPVYRTKRQVLEDHNIVVWRFHDYWHAHRPDGINAGVLKKLGWESYADPARPRICTIPSTSLTNLALFAKRRFGAERVRVVGQPDMPCTQVGLAVGAVGGQRQIEMLREVDVIIVGEVREWETTEYIRDAQVQSARPIGLIAVGHALSEEPGMAWLAEWLEPRLPDIRVVHVAAEDPFFFV
ncbi:MAG: Nif3-like dinuclear metal center hexameric protein [Bacteroidota bacterium]|nr:Nif3-like dinuclear metal center hexameric protein [Bacteroidota bacterium]